MSMTIKGTLADAVIYADEIEKTAEEQILRFLGCEVFEGAKIRIMPDCHAGSGAVIGFTCPVGDKIIPNVIGVDIGCGVMTSFDTCDPLMSYLAVSGFDGFDAYLRKNVPSGFSHRSVEYPRLREVYEAVIGEGYGVFRARVDSIAEKIGQDSNKVWCQVGTLGGGNHFIEIDEVLLGVSKFPTIVIHSGSRNFGLRIAHYHQAKAQVMEKSRTRRQKGSDLAWLEGDDALVYLNDMRTAQIFAQINRAVILDCLMGAWGGKLEPGSSEYIVESVHNFIGDDGIIRKGAVSARQGELVIIPWNMRDGAIFGCGKGNEEWNNSAPHGSGRKMSRGDAKRTLSVDAFAESMVDAGIWSSCVGVDTLDEAPDAYKPTSEILSVIGETVDIIATMKPVYNFKAGKE